MPLPKLLSSLLATGNPQGACEVLCQGASIEDAREAAYVAVSTHVLTPAQEAPWIAVLEVALGYGVPVDYDDGAGSLLSKAARQGGLGRMRLLLEKGANPNPPASPNIAGTPLMHAVEFNQFDAAKLLLSHGADIHARDRTGQTALFWAVREASWKMQDILLEHGANLQDVDEQGRTLLHQALRLATTGSTYSANMQNLEDARTTIQRLVKLGVSPDTVDANGVSVWQDATRYDPSVLDALRRSWAETQAQALGEQVSPATGVARRRSL